jgi:hypothetical protein
MELQPSGQLDSLNVEELRRKKTPTISEMPIAQKCVYAAVGILICVGARARIGEGEKGRNPARTPEKRNCAVSGREAEMAFGSAPAKF